MIKKCIVVLLIFLLHLSCVFADSKIDLKEIERILELPEEEINIARAKLTIDKIVDPSINIDQYLAKIDQIVNDIKELAGTERPDCKAINTYLYKKGPWNNYKVYSYNLNDPTCKDLKNNLLSTYLDTKKGNCTSMPILYYSIARSFNYAFYLAKAPNHIFLMAMQKGGKYAHCDPTYKGCVYTRDYYIKEFTISQKALDNGLYLRPLTNKEAVSVLLAQASVFYGKNNKFQTAIDVCDLSLKYYPKNAKALSNKAGIFHSAADYEFDSRDTKTLTGTKNVEYVEWLREKRNKYLKKAEVLGWRKKTREEKQEYIEVTKRMKEELTSKDFKLEEIERILELPEEEIDIAKAKLTIDKVIDPSINIDYYLEKIDTLIEKIKAIPDKKPGSKKKRHAIKKLHMHLYEKGIWNNHKKYRYDPDLPFNPNIKPHLLSTYINTKRGNCVSMPVLYYSLAKRLGINAFLANAPEHTLVQVIGKSGKVWNIETTDDGNLYGNDLYIEKQHISEKAVKKKLYLQPLTKKESVASLLNLLIYWYLETDQLQKAMYVCDLVIKHYPKNPGAIYNKGAIYGAMFNHELALSKGKDISDSENKYQDWLESQYWKHTYMAEDMGWQKRPDGYEEKYLETIRKKLKEIEAEKNSGASVL